MTCAAASRSWRGCEGAQDQASGPGGALRRQRRSHRLRAHAGGAGPRRQGAGPAPREAAARPADRRQAPALPARADGAGGARQAAQAPAGPPGGDPRLRCPAAAAARAGARGAGARGGRPADACHPPRDAPGRALRAFPAGLARARADVHAAFTRQGPGPARGSNVNPQDPISAVPAPTEIATEEPQPRGPNLEEPQYYFNRELSWLDFNERVLQLAEDASVPLMERLKFAAIFTSNLDEFFMIRVAGLHDQVDAGLANTGADGRTPAETIDAI